MTIKLGVHAGPQDLSMADLHRLWQRADEGGFYWISVWDHFYANPINQRTDPCFEAVAAMASLASLTSRVRVGCLVFCTLFRSPGLLAKAAVTIDHISGGRCELGLGAGWFEEEFHEFGYGYPPLKDRLDQMEEAYEAGPALSGAAQTGTPILIVYGGRDEIIPNEAMEEVLASVNEAIEVKHYAEGYHMIFRDLEAAPRWDDVANWLMGNLEFGGFGGVRAASEDALQEAAPRQGE